MNNIPKIISRAVNCAPAAACRSGSPASTGAAALPVLRAEGVEMILRAILFILLLGGVLVTGTGAWVLAGVIDMQQDGVLITLAGTACYASACMASLYGLWQIVQGVR